jgi:hypothetical protein
MVRLLGQIVGLGVVAMALDKVYGPGGDARYAKQGLTSFPYPLPFALSPQA